MSKNSLSDYPLIHILMNTIFRFIFKSSADATRTSATVKFALLGIIPYIMHATDIVCRLGYECVSLDTSLLEAVATGVAEAVFLGLSLLSVIGTVVGLFRKIYLTVVGENQTLQ